MGHAGSKVAEQEELAPDPPKKKPQPSLAGTLPRVPVAGVQHRQGQRQFPQNGTRKSGERFQQIQSTLSDCTENGPAPPSSRSPHLTLAISAQIPDGNQLRGRRGRVRESQGPAISPPIDERPIEPAEREAGTNHGQIGSSVSPLRAISDESNSTSPSGESAGTQRTSRAQDEIAHLLETHTPASPLMRNSITPSPRDSAIEKMAMVAVLGVRTRLALRKLSRQLEGTSEALPPGWDIAPDVPLSQEQRDQNRINIERAILRLQETALPEFAVTATPEVHVRRMTGFDDVDFVSTSIASTSRQKLLKRKRERVWESSDMSVRPQKKKLRRQPSDDPMLSPKWASIPPKARRRLAGLWKGWDILIDLHSE